MLNLYKSNLICQWPFTAKQQLRGEQGRQAEDGGTDREKFEAISEMKRLGFWAS